MKHTFLDLYREGDSLIHRLDPRVKFLATLGFVLAASLLPLDYWPGYLALLALALAAIVAAQVPLGAAVGRSLVVLPFALVAAASLPFVRPGPTLGVLGLGPWRLTVTTSGALALGGVLAKSWLSVLAAGLLTATTPFSELLGALQSLGLPRLLVAVVSFLYRYLFVLVDEAERLWRARESRSACLTALSATVGDGDGGGSRTAPTVAHRSTGSGREQAKRPRGGGLWWRARVLGGMIGSLFIRGYERSERVYQAMVARGYNGAISYRLSAIGAPSPLGGSEAHRRTCSLSPEGEREQVRGDSCALAGIPTGEGRSHRPPDGLSCGFSPSSSEVQGRTGCGIPELGPDSLERPHPPTPSPHCRGEGESPLGGCWRAARPPANTPHLRVQNGHILEIDGLSFSYPDGRQALHDVCLRVAEGEKVAITGPNGAGKSTLFLHLNGLLRGRGRVSVGGLEVAERNLPAIRALVGLVFQDPDDQLFSPTVLEDVAFGPLYMGLSETEVRERVRQALGAVGAAGYEARMPHHLSLGERKRVAIATVLAMQPRLLVLDEPSSGLDPRGRRGLIELLRSLPQTMLIASHDLRLVRELCPRTVILDGGRIVADGPTEAILADRALLEAHGLEVP